MTVFVVIPRGNGYISHSNVDVDEFDLADDAEIYDDRDKFEDRISDFEQD